MLSDATLTADIIKQFAKNAVDSTMPFSFHYGTVKSTDPIEIEVEQKLILTENDLIFTTLVQDFDVDMYMEHTTEKTDLIHNHKATPVVVGTVEGKPFTQTDGVYDHENGIVTVPGTYTAIDKTGDEHNHSHEYKGVKTFTVNLKLAKDEKVLLLRIQGGQKFLVLDRVRTLNDTEFTDEFEGSGSSGSSDSGNTAESGSSGSTDSGGGNSGSTDSGNGGNDSGSTDNENPDTGDNGNSSGGSVSDIISVTALMTALLSLTDEQKKEIGLTGVTIDDENITDSSTWSSQKIQDSVNANTFEISKLNETTELSGECCIPIVQGTETKKIKVDTLQSELNDKINAINEKLPEQATNENKLADKDFVNSSISTNTSYFIGTFNSLSELQASNKTITKNDYAFIVETDDVGNIKYNRYKWNGSEWLFEYTLNNSSFTSNQWKTINSNITEEWKNSIESNIETEIAERKSADTSLQNQINNKVDKVSGKGLSTNDFTNEDKNKLADIKGVNLSNSYYYTAETGIKYYWYKIIDSSVFNATNRYIKLKFKLASDNNYPLKAEYILDVSHYLTSTTKNLSVSLKNIYADKDSNDSNIIIAVDENYNVYAQFCCQWECYVNITKEFGNINFISEKLNYASFNGEITNITPKQKVTRQGKFAIRKNLTSGVYTVDSVTDTISYGISSKAIADESGNNIESTYLKKTAIDTAMSSTSTNPVQNKVVSTMINTLSTNLNTLATQVGAMNSGYACAYACDAAAGTKAKRITVKGFQLTVGACIKVVFVLGNEVSKPTLNVNSTGDKEIKLHRFKDGYGQDLSLDGTNGFYTWNEYTTLDLYYNGAAWIVLGNPVVCNNVGYPTTQYRICIDGYKEIRGTYSYGNISSKKDINVTISLPLALMEPTYCHVSLTARHSAESYPQSGEEMTYYISSSSLKIHFFNRNESTTMNGVSFDWMIQGY